MTVDIAEKVKNMPDHGISRRLALPNNVKQGLVSLYLLPEPFWGENIDIVVFNAVDNSKPVTHLCKRYRALGEDISNFFNEFRETKNFSMK